MLHWPKKNESSSAQSTLMVVCGCVLSHSECGLKASLSLDNLDKCTSFKL